MKKLATSFAQLPQYLAIGIVSVAVNLVVFSIANAGTENIYFATFIGNLSSIFVNFTGLNKVFISSALAPTVLKYSISLIVFYFVSVTITILIIKLGAIDLIARAITIAVLFPLVYLVNKYLVFK